MSPGKRSTLQTRQRHTVMGQYRARGHANNNLWLVYSPKTQRDWILPSDRQLLHWIHFLETCPEVKTFDLNPEPVLGHDGERNRMTQLDAVVTYVDGRIEWHEVKADDPDLNSSQLNAQRSASDIAERIYRTFSDKDLAPFARASVRWLKAICYVAALRGREHGPQRLALLAYLRSQAYGTVHGMVEHLTGHDAAVLMGLLADMAIAGHIELDLVQNGFGLATTWRWRKLPH